MAITKNRKWKHVVLSIESRLSVLDSVAKEVSYSELSEKFDIGKSTITSLKNNEAKIREFATTFESTSNAISKSESHAAREGRGT